MLRAALRHEYDVRMLDTKPDLDLSVTSALAAATHVLAPTLTWPQPIYGVVRSLGLVADLQEGLPDRTVIGFLPSAYNGRGLRPAALGSLVNRIEDVNSITTPLNVILIVTYFLSISALGNPDADYVRWLSYVPFFTPMLMFIRVSLSNPAWWEPLMQTLNPRRPSGNADSRADSDQLARSLAGALLGIPYLAANVWLGIGWARSAQGLWPHWKRSLRSRTTADMLLKK